ncbi:MAG TPA: type I 3-dehydroquinate dehydratase [Holophagaceae bacterium]|jgi:3-dehydroquinate dehydratase/shikimate dehydrogenase|nr:type I 3-dehydroquinate dehydratase [Holophagaceae bacterium]
MTELPFYIVTLTHATWDAARACARALPDDALPELRLDLFPDSDAASLVRGLGGRCLVTNRRVSEGGCAVDETARLDRLRAAVEGGAAWVDLEWELPLPAWLDRGRAKVLRSVHVAPGVFDLDERLEQLPEGDAFKWVGHAVRLADNAKVKPSFGRGLALSAFLMGPKGLPSRCLQRAWGGAFTYAAPDDAVPAAPGQVALSAMRAWGCAELASGAPLMGVLGSPVVHSKGPAFHNPRLRGRALYLPLDCADADEAVEALEALAIPCASITAPLKDTLPVKLGLRGPLNTIWREAGAWCGANTDADALRDALLSKPKGTVLLLGSGGVAETSRAVLEELGCTVLQTSRASTPSAASITQAAPIGAIQATSLGMAAGDPLPFPELLDAARPSLRWAVEWVYKERTAFAGWAADLDLVGGAPLFESQAEAQSRIFLAAIR